MVGVLSSLLATLFSIVLAVPAEAGRPASPVVRDVRAATLALRTVVVVDVDGDFRYRTWAGPDGASVQVEVASAVLADSAPRVLPVSDGRVAGVLVVASDPDQGVRLSVDVSDRSPPHLRTSIVESTLVLEFSDEPLEAVEPTPAPASASVRRASARRVPVRERSLVVLDPGHGGRDPGATAWTGEYEKDIVLDLADRIARRLRRRGDLDVVLTRSTDRYVTLENRRRTSARWQADVFVSIHANASERDSVRGVETYFRSTPGPSGEEGTDNEVRRLARIENAGRSDRSGTGRGVAAQPARGSSALGLDRRAESAQLARAVQAQLVHQLGMRYETVRDLGVKEGPFFVLGSNAAPSVLVEAAFLTHREEGLRMRSELYREQIAEGVAHGIVLFLEQQKRSGAL